LHSALYPASMQGFETIVLAASQIKELAADLDCAPRTSQNAHGESIHRESR
jgi:hypothetical protein